MTLSLVCIMTSCDLFSPRRAFEKNLRNQGRYRVIYWKSNDGTKKITTEIISPDSKVTYFEDNDVTRHLKKVDIDNAVYSYVGDWTTSEKKIRSNYQEEYRSWAIKEGLINDRLGVQ